MGANIQAAKPPARSFTSLGDFVQANMPARAEEFAQSPALSFNRRDLKLTTTIGGGTFVHNKPIKAGVKLTEETFGSLDINYSMMLAASQFSMWTGLPSANPLVIHGLKCVATGTTGVHKEFANPAFNPIYHQLLFTKTDETDTNSGIRDLPRFESLLETLFPKKNYDKLYFGEYGFGFATRALEIAATLGFHSVGFEVMNEEEQFVTRVQKRRLADSPQADKISSIFTNEPDQARRFPFLDIAMWSNLDPILDWLPWDILTAHIKIGGYLVLARESKTFPQLPDDRDYRRWELLDRRITHLIPTTKIGISNDEMVVDIWQRTDQF